MALADLISVGVSSVGLLLFVAGLLLFRSGRRSAEPTCPACGYAMAGLRGVEREGHQYAPVTCPECGHAARKRMQFFRRKRRPAWLPLAFLGIAILVEPLVFGNTRRVYDRLSDATIAHLHANWDDPYARDIVQGRIGIPSTTGTIHYSAADTRTLAEGAIRRIEAANARGRSEAVDPLDLRILSLHDNAPTDPAFSARVAAAMPPLFIHPDPGARHTAAGLSCDRHDPASTLPTAVAAAQDQDPRVRHAATQAVFMHLRRGQGDGAAFVALLDDDDAGVRAEAARLLRRIAQHSALPASLLAPLKSLRPRDEAVARARDAGLFALLQGDELVEACRQRLREGTDEERWEALRFVGRRPALTAALLPEWGKERRPLFEHWLPAQTVRPIDEVLEELGFE
ncbi:MAG: hypothetical protein RIE32_01735 [Phycisphaerales bacterium]